MMRRLLPLAIGLLVLTHARVSIAQSEREIVERSSKATALVIVHTKMGEGSGSAFCVHDSGLFVTNFHVVEKTALRDEVTLVLRPGDDDQRVVKAKIVLRDSDADLAVLKVDGVKDLVALPLGKTADAFVTMQVAAYGYPFGTQVGFRKDGYPNVSVNLCRVSALRKTKGAINAIQIDNQLNPGNSGGPVVGPGGKVVGVVKSGIVGAAINFAIPVGRVLDLLETPAIAFEPPTVTFRNRAKPVDWIVRLKPSPFTPPTSLLSVSMTIMSNPCEERELKTVPLGDTFRATAAPLPADAELAVEVTAILPEVQNPSMREKIATGYEFSAHDAAIRIGKESLRLSDLRSVEIGKEQRAFTKSGKILKGPFAGLDRIRLSPGPTPSFEDVQKLEYLVIRPIKPGGSAAGVEATITVRHGDRVIARVAKVLQFMYAPGHVHQSDDDFEAASKILPAANRLYTRPALTQPPQAEENRLDKEGALDATDFAPFGSGRSIRPPQAEVGRAAFTSTAEFPEPFPPANGTISHIFSPTRDNRRILTSGADFGQVRIYDAVTRAEIQSTRLAETCYSKALAFLPDGQHCVAADINSRVHLFDLKTGRVVRTMTGHVGPVEAIAVSPDGRRALSSGLIGPVRLWNLETGKELRTLVGSGVEPPKLSSIHPCNGLAFLADGLRAVSSNNTDGVVRLWDLESGREIRAFDAKAGSCGPLAVSPDGRILLAGYGDGSLRAFEVDTGKQIARLVHHAEAEGAGAGVPDRNRLPRFVECVTFTPDSRFVISAGDDRDRSVRVWDVAAGREAQPPRHGPPVHALAVSADGRTVFQAETGLTSWRLEKSEPAAPPLVRKLEGKMVDAVAGGGGRYLLIKLKDPARLAIFDVNAADVVGHLPLPSDDAMVAAGAEKFVVASSSKNVIQRWDLATRKKEAEAPWPIRGQVRGLGMGSDSAGPIFATWAGLPGSGPIALGSPLKISLVSLDRLKVLNIPSIRVHQLTGDIYQPGVLDVEMPASSGVLEDPQKSAVASEPRRVLASADGRLFACDAGAFALHRDTLRQTYPAYPWGHVVPGPDGWRWFKSRRMPLLVDGTSRTDYASSIAPFEALLPTPDPAYYLAVAGREKPGETQTGPPDVKVFTARGHLLATIAGLDEMGPIKGPYSVAPLSEDQLELRYSYIPAAGLLMTIPLTNDRIVLRRLAIADLLDRREGDVPLLLSPPILRVSAGRPLRHQLRASVKKGEPVFSKSNGAEGCDVSKDGLMTWKVPIDARGSRFKFQVTIRDSIAAAPVGDVGGKGAAPAGAPITDSTNTGVTEMIEVLVD